MVLAVPGQQVLADPAEGEVPVVEALEVGLACDKTLPWKDPEGVMGEGSKLARWSTRKNGVSFSQSSQVSFPPRQSKPSAAKNCKPIGFHSQTSGRSWSVPPLLTERLRKMATELKQSVMASGSEPAAPAPHFFPEAHSTGPKLPCSGPDQEQMSRLEPCSAEWGRLPRNTVLIEMACGGVWGQSHPRRAMKAKSQRQR